MISLGDYLKNAREENNMSMNTVFQKTGVTTSKLSRLENNLCKEPSPLDLKALSKCYSISIVDLFVMAGYLGEKSLNHHSEIFKNTEHLTEDDIKHIQGQIDYIISKQR